MPTPAELIRSATASVPSWLSQTAWLMPNAVSGTVATPARVLTVTTASAGSAAAVVVVAAGRAAATSKAADNAATRGTAMGTHPSTIGREQARAVAGRVPGHGLGKSAYAVSAPAGRRSGAAA